MTIAGVDPRAAQPGATTAPLLQVENLQVSIGGTRLLADISLSARAGELIGLVGESGSGKTLTGLSLMGLLPPGAEVQGRVLFEGVDLRQLSETRLRQLRGDAISMIFQEPRASLHPARPIGKQMVDVLRAHEETSVAAARSRAQEMLAMVGLPNPRRTMNSFTHELSGGMCQRVMIAMALVCRPRLLIADEPTTALDVTIQAQVIELLRRLADELDLAVVMITHNLGAVASLCSRVVTMYCGQVVNDDTITGLLTRPQHPYPAALLHASDIDLDSPENWSGLRGAPANPARPPTGCRFHPRCPYVEERCRAEMPILNSTETGRTRCLRSDELELEGVRG